MTHHHRIQAFVILCIAMFSLSLFLLAGSNSQVGHAFKTDRLSTAKTFDGHIQAIAWDDLKIGESGVDYYFDVGDNTYKLQGGDFSIGPAQVKGTILDDTILVQSVENNAKAGLDPWPKAMGEIRYAVIFMSDEEPDDYAELTEDIMQNADEFVRQASYGRASIHWDLYNIEGSGPCNHMGSMNYGIDALDDIVDFTEYDGLIIFQKECNVNIAGSLGKYLVNTNDGNLQLYITWLNYEHITDLQHTFARLNIPELQAYSVTIHELGHNFGLQHSNSMDYCELDETIVNFGGTCYYTEYGDWFDNMGFALNYFWHTRHKEVVGWEGQTLEANYGVFEISKNLENIVAVKVPINPSTYENVLIDHHALGIVPLGWENNPFTHYYLEFGLPDYAGTVAGLLIRVNRESNNEYDTEGNIIGYRSPHSFVLNMDPDGNSKFFLSKGKMYEIPYSQIKITYIKDTPTGALVKIDNLDAVCGDLDGDDIPFEQSDLVMLNSHIANDLPLSEWLNGDVDGDGYLTSIDSQIFVNHIFNGAPMPTCNPNTYCETIPVDNCIGYEYCSANGLISNCAKCGCPGNGECIKQSGSYICTQPSVESVSAR